MLGALIGVAGSLIGGAMNNSAARKASALERKWSLEDQAEQFVRLRSAAEKGGFNPLTALMANPGGGMPRATAAASANYMGSAIADSALILADSYSKTRAAKQGAAYQAMQRKNQDLEQKLTKATLRPTMPGVYGIGGRNALSSALVADDASDAASAANRAALGSGLDPLPTVDPGDPRREVENKPVSTGPGFMVVDNPNLGRWYFPTIDGDEPLQWYDYPSLAAPLAIKAGTYAYDKGIQYSSYLWKQNLLDQYKPGRKYRPSPKAGYDALTGSTFPAARILQ